MNKGISNLFLPQCALTPRQLLKVQSKAIQAFVVKRGFCRTMALAIRWGPRRLGGAGFLDLEVVQGEGQILNFIKHWRTQGTIGKLLRCAVAWGQLQAGTGTPLFHYPEVSLPHYEQRYLKSLRGFLARIGGHLELDNAYVPEQQREHDDYIMDMAMASGQFTSKQIIQLNYCRLYLQVVTLSDVTHLNGAYLADWAIQGIVTPREGSIAKHLVIEQARPDAPAWKQWKKLCKILSDRLLHEPLGLWLFGSAKLHRIWDQYLDWSDNSLYVWNDGIFSQYVSISQDQFDHALECPDWWPSSTCTPVQADFVDGRYDILPESVVPILSRPPASVPRTFSDYISRLPEWERLLFDELQFLGLAPFELLDQCTAEHGGIHLTLIFCSDGSAGDNSMSFAWRMALPSGRRVVQCAGPAFGHIQSSYRGEGYGVLSAVRFVFHWFLFCGESPQWSYKYLADNTGILDAIIRDLEYDETWPNTTLEDDWDIRNEIKNTIKLIGRPASFIHVKGHQDDDSPAAELSLEAQLNIEADSLAGHYRRNNLVHRPKIPRLGGNFVDFCIDGVTIPGNYRKYIRDRYSTGALLEYIRTRNGWDDAVMSLIDWDAHALAIKRMPDKEIALVKLIHGYTPTAVRTRHYKPGASARCPRCKLVDEDVNHVIQCSDPHVGQWRRALFEKLRWIALEQLHSRVVLLDVILVGLKSWMTHTSPDFSQFPASVQLLIADQSRIGWDQLFRGRISHRWATLQQEHLVTVGSKSKQLTGRLWAVRVIQTLWVAFFELWEARNQVVHGADLLQYKERQKTRLLSEIREIHSKRHLYMPIHRACLIAPDVEDTDRVDNFVERNSFYTVRNWVAWRRPMFLQSLKDAAANAVARMRPISEYFPAAEVEGSNRPRHRSILRSRAPSAWTSTGPVARPSTAPAVLKKLRPRFISEWTAVRPIQGMRRVPRRRFPPANPRQFDPREDTLSRNRQITEWLQHSRPQERLPEFPD